VILVIKVEAACGLRVFGSAAKTAKTEQANSPSAENFSMCWDVRHRTRWRVSPIKTPTPIRVGDAGASDSTTKSLATAHDWDGAAFSRTRKEALPPKTCSLSLNMTVKAASD